MRYRQYRRRNTCMAFFSMSLTLAIACLLNGYQVPMPLDYGDDFGDVLEACRLIMPSGRHGRGNTHTLNSTATARNPGCTTPYEMWYRKVPPRPFPFLKPGFVQRKRANKLEPKAVPCFYIGPPPPPPTALAILVAGSIWLTPANFTRARVPSLTSVRVPPTISVPECGEGGKERNSRAPVG